MNREYQFLIYRTADEDSSVNATTEEISAVSTRKRGKADE